MASLLNGKEPSLALKLLPHTSLLRLVVKLLLDRESWKTKERFMASQIAVQNKNSKAWIRALKSLKEEKLLLENQLDQSRANQRIEALLKKTEELHQKNMELERALMGQTMTDSGKTVDELNDEIDAYNGDSKSETFVLLKQHDDQHTHDD